MNRFLIAMILIGSLTDGCMVAAETLDPGPALSGTINVIVADDRGMVVLTDSRLSYTVKNSQGQRTYKQIPGDYQKLFQIDDHTVCTFAGFASAKTPVVDFLDNASAIMGRYEGFLRKSSAATVAEKLGLLEGVFSYYLGGVANLGNN